MPFGTFLLYQEFIPMPTVMKVLHSDWWRQGIVQGGGVFFSTWHWKWSARSIFRFIGNVQNLMLTLCVVPLIAVFTKWDGQIIKSYGKLRGPPNNMSISRARQEAARHAEDEFNQHYLPVISAPAVSYPPASFVLIGSEWCFAPDNVLSSKSFESDMHKPETKCEELSTKTAAALGNNELQKLFVSVQLNNIQLCVKYAIR
jgi:hypothetical protein